MQALMWLTSAPDEHVQMQTRARAKVPKSGTQSMSTVVWLTHISLMSQKRVLTLSCTTDQRINFLLATCAQHAAGLARCTD